MRNVELMDIPRTNDVAIADLVSAKNDTILVPINMNTKQFLKAYI
jgi:hypothetical protein